MADAATIADATAQTPPAPGVAAAPTPPDLSKDKPAEIPKSDPADKSPTTIIGAEPSLALKEADAKKDEGDKKPPAEAAKFDVKELKLPEGIAADDPSLGKFGEIISDPKLSPKERGEALLNLYAEGAKAVRDANTKLWTDTQAAWRESVTKEFGDKLAPTTQMVSKAIDTLGPELAKEFRQALDFTGAGNNPAVVKAMAKFAEVLTEGGHVPGGPGAGKTTLSQTFFPNSPEFAEQKGNG